MLVRKTLYRNNTCCILGEHITESMIQFADPIHNETIQVTINDPRLIGRNRKKARHISFVSFFSRHIARYLQNVAPSS